MSHPFSFGRGENGPDKEMVYLWISSLKRAGQILEAMKEVIRKEIFAIAPEKDLNFMENYLRVYLILSVFKAAKLVIISVQYVNSKW